MTRGTYWQLGCLPSSDRWNQLSSFSGGSSSTVFPSFTGSEGCGNLWKKALGQKTQLWGRRWSSGLVTGQLTFRLNPAFPAVKPHKANLVGREVVGCWARFSPSAGGSEPATDKTESKHLCVVSFVMLGNLSNTASKQKTPTFKVFPFNGGWPWISHSGCLMFG